MGIRTTRLSPQALLLFFFIVPVARAQQSTTIAYVSGHEIRLTEADGSGLRKLTNAPIYDQQDAYPKGTVTLAVQNSTFGGGPYFVYVEGAPEPQQVRIAPFSTAQLTFEGVADCGDDIDQPAVVIYGILRWWDAAASADVEPNAVVHAGLVEISSFRGIEHFGAEGAFWRNDDARTEGVLSYELLQPQNVTLKIRDLLGREIHTHDVGYRTTCSHAERIDFSAKSAGIYFISMIGGGGEHATARILVIK